MEDKSLENLFAQLDAEAKTEAKTEEPAEEPAEAGTDPREDEAMEILKATNAIFFAELKRALVERDLMRSGAIGKDPGLADEEAHKARNRALQEAIKKARVKIKLEPPDWLKENGPGILDLTPEGVNRLARYLAEAIVSGQKDDKGKEQPPKVNAQQTNKLDYPLDKPNSVIWNWLAGADKNGQLTLGIDTSKNATGKEPLILYSINFDALEDVRITKTLTPFDKRVYVAVAALYNAGNEIITATQIYKMMGYKGRPGDDDLQAINDSLTKMGAARLYIDTDKENRKYPKYARFKYDAALLPFERKTAYINGKLAESAIHPFREPPLITFASQRKQVTTITRALLESPVSKTEANLRLEDYLLERIGRMKNSKGVSRKMLFATIFEQCKITAPMQKQRAPEKIRRYLDHYKEVGWIDNYREEKDGVTIVLKSS